MGWGEPLPARPAGDQLAAVLAAAQRRWFSEAGPTERVADFQADAVRAAGYKSPDELAAVLDAEVAREKRRWPSHGRPMAMETIGRLRAALLEETNGG